MSILKIISFILLLSPFAVSAEVLYISEDSVAIHASPIEESEKIRSLKYGTKVFVIDRANGWVLIEDENFIFSGWVKQGSTISNKPAEKLISPPKVVAETENAKKDGNTSSLVSIVLYIVGGIIFLMGMGSSGKKDGRTRSGYKKGHGPRSANFKLILCSLVMFVFAYFLF